MKNIDLTGRRIIVTGGTNGIGRGAVVLGFLASPGSDYITGQTFSADGGVLFLGS
jgi:NAD(P)-dependent dehydrogenase (short-subunit alcohol dehydrogenase family)